ncbi:MAG: Omp28-related outer membrane protein [Candidatus Cloacimonetes bacterium]|jgi:hypothetical protein|nr:Omp28-related outer membrane protein [Candidatus Cloacimonadota bacterium]
MKKSIFLLILVVFITGLFAVPREMVVVEIATGTWCGYCPGAAMGAHDLIANGHAVAVIKNHNGDNYANTYSNARNNYYNPSGFPTAYFDGLNPTSGGSATQSMYSNYLPKVNARLNVPSNYTIFAEAELEGLVLTVDVTVTKVSDDNATNLKIRGSVTESNIPHNWGNQTTVDNVNRVMSPDANGVAITLATGDSVTETLVFNLTSTWQLPNLELVLFVQSDANKEILQGKKYSIPGLTGAMPASTQNINFDGIFVGGAEPKPVTFHNFFDTPVNATLTSDSPHFAPEFASIAIPGSQSRTINILFTPQEVGDFTGTINVVGNFEFHPEFSIAVSGSSFFNNAPIAEDVVISGAPIVYETLVGTYSYSDQDQDVEGDTELAWHIYENGNYYQLDGENNSVYHVKGSDIGLQICFSVVPKDVHGMPGETVYSEPTAPIMNIPAPENLTGVLEPPNTVVLNWQKPAQYRDRGFVGYKLYRNGLNISTITNVNNLTFRDTYVPDGTHEYWVCTFFNNPVAVSDPSNIVTIAVGAPSNEDAVSNAQFGISSSPNPFADTMSFSAKSLPSSDVKISVYNLKGQQVNSFNAIADINGEANLVWDGKDKQGRELESGVYLYKMESSGKTLSGKMIKIK